MRHAARFRARNRAPHRDLERRQTIQRPSGSVGVAVRGECGVKVHIGRRRPARCVHSGGRRRVLRQVPRNVRCATIATSDQRPATSDHRAERVGMMRTIALLVLGILIGAAAIGAVAATSAGSDGAVEVRIVAEPLEDGRVEVGLQQRQGDGEWGETEKPPLRFLPADAEIGRPLRSSPIVVDTDTRHEMVANNYAEYLFESGEGVAASFTEYFESEGITEDLPLMLCVEDLNDPSIGALCDGMESAYGGPVERLSTADYGELRARLEARVLEDEDLGGVFATSVPTADILDQVAEATRVYVPASYWIELVDPHLPDPDNLYCLISHGGEDDLFLGSRC